jgi:hypothetical protein
MSSRGIEFTTMQAVLGVPAVDSQLYLCRVAGVTDEVLVGCGR